MNAAFTLKQLQAENAALRSQLQMQVLEIEDLRRVLLALVEQIEFYAEPMGFLDVLDIEIQVQDARESLARVGLL